MKKWLSVLFYFPRKERMGILVLLVLMFGIWAIPILFPAPLKIPDAGKLVMTKTAAPPANPPWVKTTIPYFNPNTLSQKGWEQLGMPSKISKVIQNYLSKGGRFNRPEDVYKIWGISPSLVKTLIPFMRIPTRRPHQKKWKNYLPKEQSGHRVASAIAPEKRMNSFKKKLPKAPIGINTASEEDWKKLPGIGEVLSKRILKFRNHLKGFSSVDQLAKTYGISDSLFLLLKPYLVLDSFPAQGFTKNN